MSRTLYDHPALTCDLCGPNTDGWHVVVKGDRLGRLWPHRKPTTEGEPGDGLLVECDRCLAQRVSLMRQWDSFLQRWLGHVADPRLGRTRGRANAGELLRGEGAAAPVKTAATRQRVTSSSRDRGTRR